MFHKQQFLVNEKVLLKNQIMKMVWHPNLAENEQSSPQEPMHLMKEERVFSLLTDYTGQKRDVYSSGQQTEPERLHTHEAWTPDRPQTSSYVPFPLSQRCLIAQQAERENATLRFTHKPTTWSQKKTEAYVTPKSMLGV